MSEPLDLAGVRARAERYRVLAESSGAEIGPEETTAALACAEDMPVVLAELQRVRRELDANERSEDASLAIARAAVARVHALHQQYRTAWTDAFDVCSHCTRGMDLVRWPCDTIRALNGEPADRAAAVGGAGSPAREGQPPPTQPETEGDHG